MLDDVANDQDHVPQRRTWLTWLAPLGVMAALAWFLSAWHADKPRYSPHAALSFEVDQIDWQVVRASFAARKLDHVSPDDRQAISTLLVRSMRRDSPDFFEQTIDHRRLVQQIERTGYLRRLDDDDREDLLAVVTPRVFIDLPVRRFELVALESIGPHEWNAFVRVWTSSRCHLMQWWLSNRGGQWKWYDWLDLGNRRQLSEELAVIWAFEHDPLWQTAFLGGSWHRTGGPPLVLVEDHWRQGRRWSAVDKLRRAESRPVHRFVAEAYHVRLVRLWLGMNRFGDARRLLESFQRPGQIPDVALLTAQCDIAQGYLTSAASNLDRFEARLGPTPDSLRLRLKLAQIFDNAADARAICRQWLAMEPGGLEPVSALARLLSTDDVDELVRAVRSSPRPAQTLRQLVLESLRRPDIESWALLRVVAETIEPQGGLQHALAAFLAERDGELDAAADHMARAVKARRAPLRSRWNRHLISLLIRAEQWERLITDPVGPSFALWTLITSVTPDTVSKFPGRLLRLCEKFRDQNPDSMWAALMVADAAASEGQWQRAADEYERAFRFPKAVRNGRARDRWLEVCTQLEGPLAAQRKAKSHIEAFVSTASRLADNEQWDTLESLLDQYRERLPDVPSMSGCWYGYFTARLLIARGELAEADRILVQAVRHGEIVVGGGWMLNDAVPLLVERSLSNGTWRRPLANPQIGHRFRYVWFAELNRRRQEDPQADALFEEFLSAYVRAHGFDPIVVYWRVRMAWERRGYEQVYELLRAWPEEAMLSLPADRERECRRWLIASMMRITESQGVQLEDPQQKDLQPVLKQAADEGDQQCVTEFAAARGDWKTLARLLPVMPARQKAQLLVSDEMKLCRLPILWMQFGVARAF